MKNKFFYIMFLFGVLSSVFQAIPSFAAPNALDPVNCKIPYVNNRQGWPDDPVRIGWPLPQERMPGSGLQKILFLPIDFSDAPSKLTPEGLVSKVVQPENAKKFYSFQSNGSLTLQTDVHKSVLRMPQTSDEYGFWSQNRDSWILDGPKLDSDIRGVLGSFEKNFNYSSVVILVTGGSKAFNAMGTNGWAVIYGERDLAFGQPNLKNTMYLVDRDGSSMSDVFIHELGHNLGFIDLYSMGYKGDSTGPFDVMAYPGESSKSFLGWNQWLKGWIKESQVVCLNSDVLADSEIALSSLIGNGETRLIVIKESSSSAIVVEARLETEFDQMGENAGLLVYRIRPNAVRPERPVQIIPHKNIATTKAFSPDFRDTERFRSAPLTEGKYLREGSIIIENQKQSKTLVRTLISWGLNANTRQQQIDSQAKAAAELKAKQEAGAIAAAELKAKEEADAKAAAELKVKLEAAAKAAATKKSTITCLKGKLTKKVTAVEPKCPTGYRVKK
jgi:hypothetical protein